VTALHQHLKGELAEQGLDLAEGTLPTVAVRHSTGAAQVVPPNRVRYLAEITEAVRNYHARTAELVDASRRVQPEVSRATESERVRDFQDVHRFEAAVAIQRLKEAATGSDNVFAVLMDAARVCSLQQITGAFFEVGGQYQRNV
jgi:hypothetical protein